MLTKYKFRVLPLHQPVWDDDDDNNDDGDDDDSSDYEDDDEDDSNDSADINVESDKKKAIFKFNVLC
jgi:hypothetical protein